MSRSDRYPAIASTFSIAVALRGIHALDVHITYRFTADLDDEAIAAAVDRLSASERAQHDRFLFARDRRDYAVAHAMLRDALSAIDPRPPHEWTFVAGEHGKPRLDDRFASPLSFNLAHTHGFVACAIARDTDVGIDVEYIDRKVEALTLARRFFAAPETRHLEACEEARRHTRFVEIWTLKEAYVKAIGDGLTHPLHEFSFVFDETSASLRFESARAVTTGDWQFALLAPSADYRLAVAVRVDRGTERRLVVHAPDQPPITKFTSRSGT